MNAAVPENRVRAESWIFAILAAEIIALNIFWAPISLDFAHFAFCDNGANLTLQYLIAHGYRPTIDFAYLYGLLPVLIGRAWFAIVGLTPFACQLLIFLCGLGIVFAFARIAAALRFHGIAIVILIVTLWFGIHPDYPALAQAFEALLLALALSSQALDDRKSALILASLAIFAKPSMGYLYGLLLVVIWFARSSAALRRSRLFPEVVLPVGITVSACAIVLSAFYGPVAVIRTVLPTEGLSTYRMQNFGFFMGSGRRFWDPAQNAWAVAAFGPLGLWIAASIFLTCAAFAAAYRLWRRSDDRDHTAEIRDEIILTCFVLHAAFVCLFFGNQWSWIYYSYFLVIGVASAADTGPIARRAGIAICLIGALSGSGVSYAVSNLWMTRKATPVTAQMWSQSSRAAEWSNVINITSGHRTTILDTKGAAELIFPGFQPPVSLYLDPGLMLQSDIDRKVRQLADSDLVVVPLGPVTCGEIPRAPEIQKAMLDFEPIVSGQYFVVYRHTTPSAQ